MQNGSEEGLFLRHGPRDDRPHIAFKLTPEGDRIRVAVLLVWRARTKPTTYGGFSGFYLDEWYWVAKSFNYPTLSVGVENVLHAYDLMVGKKIPWPKFSGCCALSDAADYARRIKEQRDKEFRHEFGE